MQDFLNKTGQISGDVLLGFAKGVGDTLYSVKKNVQKVPIEAVRLEVAKNFDNARQTIFQANGPLTAQYRASQDPAQKEQLRQLLMKNAESLNEINAKEEEVTKEINAVQRGELDYREDRGLFENIMRETQDVLNQGGKALQTTNKAQEFGFAAEKIGEFLVPANLVAKGDKALRATQFVDRASKVGRAVDTTVRTGSRIGLEAGTAGLTSLGQSAYQGQLETEQGRETAMKDAGTNAAFAGAFKAGLMGLGNIARASGLPEKLARGTYKADAREIAATQAGQQGESLADWAIRQGIKGNLEDQYAQVRNLSRGYEDELVNAAKAQEVRMPVDKDLLKFVDNVWEDYATGPYKKDVLPVIDEYLGSIDDAGKAGVAETLKLKRLLDKLQPDSVFKNPKMGTDMKGWSDILRTQVNNIEELGGINKNYSKAVAAAKAIEKRAASEGNKAIMSQLDTFTAAAPLIDGATKGPAELAGLAIVGARKAVANPKIQMNTAQGLTKLGNATPFGVATRSVAGQAATEIGKTMRPDPIQKAAIQTATPMQEEKPKPSPYQKAMDSELTELDRKLMGITP